MDKRRQLLTTVLQDKNEETRKLAADALEKCETRVRLESLAKKIESAAMLEKVRAIYALTDLKGPRVVEILLKASRDPSEDVRAAAVRVLGRVADVTQIPQMLESLKDTSPIVQRVAIDILGSFRDARILGHLMHLLKNPDSGVIERAIDVIARIGDKRSEDAMLHFAMKGNPKMRNIAVKALGEMDA